MPLERLTMLVVPVDDQATLVVPELEAPRVNHDPRLFEMRPWAEHEQPTELVAALVGRRTRLAVSDRTWASHLLELERSMPQAHWRSAERSSARCGPSRTHRKWPLCGPPARPRMPWRRHSWAARSPS